MLCPKTWLSGKRAESHTQQRTKPMLFFFSARRRDPRCNYSCQARLALAAAALLTARHYRVVCATVSGGKITLENIANLLLLRVYAHCSVAFSFLSASRFIPGRLTVVCIMSAIGSLIFCNDCGNLLDESSGDPTKIVVCGVCGTRNKGALNFDSICCVLIALRWPILTPKFARYPPQNHRLRIQTQRIPLRPPREKICGPDFDGRGQEDGGADAAYLRPVWAQGDVLHGGTNAKCRRRKYDLPALRLRLQVWLDWLHPDSRPAPY